VSPFFLFPPSFFESLPFLLSVSAVDATEVPTSRCTGAPLHGKQLLKSPKGVSASCLFLSFESAGLNFCVARSGGPAIHPGQKPSNVEQRPYDCRL